MSLISCLKSLVTNSGVKLLQSVSNCTPTSNLSYPNLKILPMIRTFTTSHSLAKGFDREAFKASHHILMRMHERGPLIKKRPPRKPLGGKPFAKGVVLKTLIKKPKKPNSANRKCVLVRLTTGKEMVAYVPGIGHNLQEHQIVLVRCGRLQDVPGVKIKCVRGAYDLPHVKQ